MSDFMTAVATVNDSINSFVWVKIGLVLLIGTGILMTVLTGFFQVSHFKHWMSKTIGGVFKADAHVKHEKGSVSQFQALCTALAATIGTGNIAGVAAAICVGGPGAVFWMWIAAFLGMMTNYSENVLGIYFRRRDKNGDWAGGAMYYLADGLGAKKGMKTAGKVLAILFSCFAVLASFGIGNLAQANTIAGNMQAAFSIPRWVTGAALLVLAASSACSIVAKSTASAAYQKLVRKANSLSFSVESAEEIYSEEAAASNGQFYTWELSLLLENPDGTKIRYAELQDNQLISVLDKDGTPVPAQLVLPDGAEPRTVIPQGASAVRVHVNIAEQQNLSAVCIAERAVAFTIPDMPAHFTPVPAE